MGPWGIAAIALIGATTTEGGRKLLRTATKNVIKAGLIVKERSSSVLGELQEHFADVVAEVKAETQAKGAEPSANGTRKPPRAWTKSPLKTKLSLPSPTGWQTPENGLRFVLAPVLGLRLSPLTLP